MSALKTPYNRIMPRQAIIALLGALAGLTIHLYLILSEEYLLTEVYWPTLGGAMIVGIIIAFVAHYISQRLNGSIDWEDQAGLRLIMSISIYTLLSSACFYFFYRSFWSDLVTVEVESTSFSVVTCIKLIILTLVVSFVVSILSYALYSYRAVAQAQIDRIQLKREIVDLQMETLKSQLRPHFLFNGLNTISSLIHSNMEGAELFIRQLAKIYRYTLENYSRKAIYLRDEVALVDAYIDMMRVRFGDHITLTKDIAQELMDKRILPLSLQSLVENALKHNVVNEEHQLTISLAASDHIIRVENNKTISPASVESNNIGLSNLQKRYRLWDNHKVSIYDHKDSFAVTIPIE